MSKRSKLSIIAIALSLLMLGQSIFIIDFLNKDTQLAQVFVSEIVQEKEITKTVQVWLEDVSLPGNQKTVSIWMKADEPVVMVDIKLKFSTSDLKIIDNYPQTPGTQIAMGQAPQYLLNKVDNQYGMIRLLSKFPDKVQGKILLGIIELNKNYPDQLSKIEFDYFENLKQGSYAITEIGGDNIMSHPKNLEI
jgi:hypothetical protein